MRSSSDISPKVSFIYRLIPNPHRLRENLTPVELTIPRQVGPTTVIQGLNSWMISRQDPSSLTPVYLFRPDTYFYLPSQIMMHNNS